MKTRELRSLQFNTINWGIFQLGEKTILLQAPSDVSVQRVHESARQIQEIAGEALTDIVPAYTSVALFYAADGEALLDQLATASFSGNEKSGKEPEMEIPICYELGLDLEEVAQHAGISVEKLIKIHLEGAYKAILIGFTPGFIYMDGLDERLVCPRKANPRKRLADGSVGIGGEQTGIYSLASPGGWNIIGRTPAQLFDKGKKPPMSISVGTQISYRRISRKEFEAWEH